MCNNGLSKEDKLFLIIREELNKVDPIGVFKHNPNVIDEYDLENERILPFVTLYSDHIEFAKKICEIVSKTTCLNLHPEWFYECAENILNKAKQL